MIATPDVYKSSNSDCYIVFGEAKIEDGSSQNPLGVGPNLGADLEDGAKAGDDDDDDDVPALVDADAEAEDEVDETGVDPKDIELVMTQVNCSRAKAVKVLKESGGDLINASKLLHYPVPSIGCLTFHRSHGCERVVSWFYCLLCTHHLSQLAISTRCRRPTGVTTIAKTLPIFKIHHLFCRETS